MSVDQYNVDPEALYVARLSDGKIERHVLCRLKSAMDGGMFEYVDPASGETVGSVGCNRVGEFVQPIQDFLPANKIAQRGDLTNGAGSAKIPDIYESKEVHDLPDMTLFIELSPDADGDAIRKLLVEAGAQAVLKGARMVELTGDIQPTAEPVAEEPLRLAKRVAVSPLQIRMALEEAIENQQVVKIDYVDRHGRRTTGRAIRPLRIAETIAGSSLVSVDLNEDETRNFYLFRIERVEA